MGKDYIKRIGLNMTILDKIIDTTINLEMKEDQQVTKLLKKFNSFLQISVISRIFKKIVKRSNLIVDVL